MRDSNISGSMRDVLIRANTVSSSPSNSINSRGEKTKKTLSTAATGLNFAGVTWKSIRTANLEAELIQNGRGQYFPAKLALALGMAKILMGLLFITFGVLATFEKATYSQIGSGMWTGSMVIVCGFLGLMAGKNRKNAVYIVSFLVTSLLELAVVGLMLVFTTTGLLKDSNSPMGYFVDEENNGKRVEFLGKIPLYQRAVIVNAVLVALGTLEILLALASIAICAREACFCYKPDPLLLGSHANLLEIDTSPEGRAKADRLAHWIRQQTTYQQIHAPRVMPPLQTIYAPVLAYPAPHLQPQSLPPSLSHRSLRQPFRPPRYRCQYPTLHPWHMPHHVPPVDYDINSVDGLDTKKKRKRKKMKRIESPPLSDNLSQTYTGLDRDIAEEFIQQTMDPSRSLTLRNIVLDKDEWVSEHDA